MTDDREELRIMNLSARVRGSGYAPGHDHAKIHIRSGAGLEMLCGVTEHRMAWASLWSADQVEKLRKRNSPKLCARCARIAP